MPRQHTEQVPVEGRWVTDRVTDMCRLRFTHTYSPPSVLGEDTSSRSGRHFRSPRPRYLRLESLLFSKKVEPVQEGTVSGTSTTGTFQWGQLRKEQGPVTPTLTLTEVEPTTTRGVGSRRRGLPLRNPRRDLPPGRKK